MTTKATSPLLLLSLGVSLIVTARPANADDCVGLECNLNSVYVDLATTIDGPFLVSPNGGPVSSDGVWIAVSATGCLPTDVYTVPIELRVGADTVEGDFRESTVLTAALPTGSIYCVATDFDVEPSYYWLDFTQPQVLAWARTLAEDHKVPYSWHVIALVDPPLGNGDNDGTIDENGNYPDQWYTTEEYSDNFGSAAILGKNIIPASTTVYVGDSPGTYTGPAENWAVGTLDCPTGFEIGEGQLSVTPGSSSLQWNAFQVAVGLGEPEPSFEYVCARPDLSRAGPAGVPLIVTPIQAFDSATGSASATLSGFDLHVDYELSATGATLSNGSLELPAGLSWHDVTELPPGWDQRYRGFASPRGRTRFPLQFNPSDMGNGFEQVFAGRQGYGARPVLLASETLPFAVQVHGIEVDSSSSDPAMRVRLVGPFTPHWLRDPALPSLSGTYGPIDASRNRAVLNARGPNTNDVMYSAVTLGCVVLAPDGLWAATGLDAGTGITHFPRLDLTWSAEPSPTINTCSTESTSQPGHGDNPSYFVRASKLAKRLASSSKVRARVDLRTDCPECSTTQSFTTLTIPAVSDPEAGWNSNAQGTLGFGGTIGDRVEWGPNAHTTLNTFGKIWRHESAGQVARVIVPGFVAIGTEGRPVVDYLLAAFAASGKPILFGDEETKRGNGFFAGATLGPEIYRDANGQPQTGDGDTIASTALDAALGGPEGDADGAPRVSLTLAPGAKYVVRPGGVTGAFNFTSIPSPTVYGFPLALTRFAFTVLDNAGSPSSWVDGQLDLPAWAGFSVPFVSLTLECSGHLGGGIVDRGLLASLPASKKRLRAWRADYDLSDVAFIPKIPAAGKCGAGPRELSTSGAATIAALAQKVDLTSAWEPTGAPSATNPPKLRGSSQLEFNRPAVVGEVNLGFTLDAKADQVSLAKTSEATWSDTVRGWFEFGGGLRLPFWKSPPVVVRLQNTLNEASTAAIADRTLVRKGGSATSALWTQSNTSEPLWAAVSAREPPSGNPSDPARQAWDDAKLETPFPWVFDQVKFPMRWLPDSQQRPVLVAGSNQPDPGADLGIIKVQAAAPSTTPRETNITFGASADLKVLTKISVPTSIDLFSESNIKAIDTFLRDVTKISSSCPAPNQNESGPLWCILKDIRTPSKFIAAAVGSKFSGVVQGAVSALFDTALGPVLDKFAEVVTVIQAAPTQLVNAGMAQLTALVDQGLAALTTPLSGEVRKLYNDVPQAMADAMAQLRPPSLTVGVTLPPAIRDALVTACQLLDDENKCPLKSDGTRIGFSFVGALMQVQKLESQVSGAIASVKSALIGSSGNGGLIGNLTDGLKVARCLLAKTRKTLGEADNALGTINLTSDCNFPAGHPARDIFNGLDAAKVALGLFSCNNGVPAQQNVVFSKVNEIASAIDKVLAAAESDTIPGIVQGVGAFLGLDLTSFTQSLKEVGAYAKKIRARLKDAQGAVNKAFCGVGGGITQITVPVRGFLGKLAGPLDSAAKATGGLAASVTAVANMLNGVTTQVTAKITLAVSIANRLKSDFRNKVIILIQYNDELAAAVGSVTIDTTAIDTLPRTKQEFQQLFDDALTLVESQLQLAPGTLYFVSPDPTKGTIVDLVANQLKQPLYDLIGNVQSQVGSLFTDLMQQIPFPKKAELRQMLSRLVIESSFVRDLDKLLEQCIRLVLEEVDKLAARLVEQLNQFLREAINKALEVVAKALEAVTAPIEKAAGFTGASLDGYAKIVGNAVQLLQIDARFGSKPAKGSGDESKRKDEEQSFRASLLMKSWAMSDKGKNCLPQGGVGADAPGAGYLDATISAYNLPFTMGGKGGLKIQELSIGFTLNEMTPIGINGALITTGKLDFKAFSIRDIRFAMGFGELENYVGAAAGANFSGYDMSVAFLVGRMCDDSVLRKLDPQFAGFVKVPGEFAGGYVRGSASIPVFNIGCVFQVGFGADFGAWFLNKAVGGLIGGSVFGKIACLVSVRGTVRMGFTYNLETSKPFFKGQGWCAAGLGFCSPEEWMTVEDSRKDGGLCLTMDALIDAEYEDSFELKKLDITGPH